MCEFISAVKAKDKKGKDKYYFLTHDLIHNTPRGEIIQKQFPGDGEIIGHSAIRSYFNLQSNEGSGWECADFSTPKNFPAVIVKALKRGEFKGFPLPKGLLSKPLDDKYWADRKSLHDKYWDLFTIPENRAEAWR